MAMPVSEWLKHYPNRDLLPYWGEVDRDEYWYEKLITVPEQFCMPEVEEDL